jgi:hypothetical protein
MLSGVNSLPWSSLDEYYGVYILLLDFLLGYLKYASLGIGQILEAGFKWYTAPFVVGRSPCDMCSLTHTQFLPISSFYGDLPSQFKFPY